MTVDAKNLIQVFAALPDPAKREVPAELLRISGSLDYPQMEDDDLTAAANALFLTSDKRENPVSRASSTTRSFRRKQGGVREREEQDGPSASRPLNTVA